MTSVFSALLPVFFIIALGAALKRTLLPERDAWDAFERLTFYVLFPALLFVTTATADLGGVPVLGTGGALFAAVLAMSALLLALRVPLMRALALDGAAFTSLFQGAARWNSYVALAIGGSLYGALGLALVSVAIVAMVPVLNLVCVLVLARYAAETAPDARRMVRLVLRNPLIWPVLAGIAANFAGVPLPRLAAEFLDILGRAALTLGLLAVGAGLELAKVWPPQRAVIAAVVLKLFLMPALAIPLALAFGLEGAALAVVAVASSVPSAPGAYILARQMGGDAPLIAQMLTAQTVIALATIPAVLAITGLVAPLL